MVSHSLLCSYRTHLTVASVPCVSSSLAMAPKSTPMGWRPQMVFLVRERYRANSGCAVDAFPGGMVRISIASRSRRVIDS